MAARKLAMNVIGQCAGKLEPVIKHFIVKSMSGEESSSQIDYHEIIYDIYRCAPQALTGIVPYLTGELLVRIYPYWVLGYSETDSDYLII